MFGRVGNIAGNGRYKWLQS